MPHFKRISKTRIAIIPHSQQRYETTGDWQLFSLPDGTYEGIVFVSDMGDWRYNMLIGHHELTEMLLCTAHNISQEDVDAFDQEYESNRQPGDKSEPGDDINAPYYKEHQIATAFERAMAAELGVDWNAYEKAVWAVGGAGH